MTFSDLIKSKIVVLAIFLGDMTRYSGRYDTSGKSSMPIQVFE